MEYLDTRGGPSVDGFGNVALAGLAPSGGLYVPKDIPRIHPNQVKSWSSLSYMRLAQEINKALAPEHPALQSIVADTYTAQNFGSDAITPLVSLVRGVHVLELFHGKTLSFKDIALEALGRTFEYELTQRGTSINILGATSGDTGSAAINGMKGRKRINTFITYPEGRVSPLQAAQMASVLADNVFAVAVVNSDFDECQEGLVKPLMRDLEFKDKYRLAAINSINWARIQQQIVYYAFGAYRAQEAEGTDAPVDFSVPTGNFGDALAGYYARQMGFPIGNIILATNENDVLARFVESHVYQRQKDLVPTPACSMDIKFPSNFERYLFETVNRDATTMGQLFEVFERTGVMDMKPYMDVWGATGGFMFKGGKADTRQRIEAIRHVHAETSYVMEHHTAAGFVVGFQNKGENPLVCLATASPAKFEPAMADALPRVSIQRPAHLNDLESAVQRTYPLRGTLEQKRQGLRNLIQQFG